jgi:anti-sigma B factor antagonist
MENLEITKEIDGTAETLTLTGRLSIVTSPQLMTEVDEIAPSIKMLRFVMPKVEYVSSAGLRVIVAAQKKMSSSGGSLEIVSPTAEIIELFDMTGLKDILTVK